MIVHVIVGVYKGVLNETFISLSAEEAKTAHERMCRHQEVPLFCGACGADSDEEHKKFQESDSDNDVQHQMMEVDASPIIDSLVWALSELDNVVDDSHCLIDSEGTTRRLIAQEFVAALNRRRLVYNAEAEKL